MAAMTANEQRILVIETSSRVGSVAIATTNDLVKAERLPGLMRHAGELMPAIDAMLKEAGWPADSLTDVYISVGPGSFTGLRIAVTVARTLAWSIGARIVAVPTVDGLSRNALVATPRPEHVAVILDAKQAQVFAAAFSLRNGEYEKVIDAHMAPPAEFLARCPRPLAVLGEGIPYHRPAIDAAGVDVLHEDLWWPRAEHVLTVGRALASAGRFTPGGELLPLYIRRPEAEEKWERLHGPDGIRKR